MFIDILVGMLLGAEDDGKEAATAQAVKRWGVDKIMSAVAELTGEITGYLVADEIESWGFSNVGIYMKVGDRQVHIDFVNEHQHGNKGPHIDFQPDSIGGKKYAKLYLKGLMKGLQEAL